MESLKKVISLNQAAKISGYSQDYLGYLIRNGEIKATKKGRAWFTTEEEVNNYIFKKKVQHQEFAVKDFFSPTRSRNIVIITVIIFIGGFLFLSNLNKSKASVKIENYSAIKSDGGSLIINN